MRVLYLTNNANLGSTARVLQEWIALAQEAGNVPSVVVPRAGALADWLTQNRVEHRVSEMPWPNRWWPVPSLWHAQRLTSWARRRRVDVIHCNEHDVYPFGVLVRRMLGVPIVCSVQFALSRPFSEWAFGGQLPIGGTREPDAVIWTSHAQQRECAAAVEGLLPTARQSVIPLGTDPAHFATYANTHDTVRQGWNVEPDEIVVGSACALRPIKRVHEFVELIGQLTPRHPRVVGVIAGDAPVGDEAYRDRMLARIKELNLGRRLIWLGNLVHVEPFMNAVDVFVSTSEFETFGMSVCEAMACAKPVAAYKASSVEEVVGDSGLTVDTGDFAALLAATDRLVADRELRESLGRRARQRVDECFHPAKSFEQVSQLYRSIAGDSSATSGTRGR